MPVKHLTRADIEHTLRKSNWYLYAKDCWEHISKRESHSPSAFYIVLSDTHIFFNSNLRPRIRYKKMTSEFWTELTGLQFHRREK